MVERKQLPNRDLWLRFNSKTNYFELYEYDTATERYDLVAKTPELYDKDGNRFIDDTGDILPY